MLNPFATQFWRKFTWENGKAIVYFQSKEEATFRLFNKYEL